MLRPIPALGLLAFLAVAACSRAGGPPVRPAPGAEPVRLESALARASRSGRNVLIAYCSEDCDWCQKMDAEVYPSVRVQEALGRVEFVRVEKNVNAGGFEARWGRQGTPSFVVLRPDGSQAGDLLTGAMARDDFLVYLAWAARGEGPIPNVRLFGA